MAPNRGSLRCFSERTYDQSGSGVADTASQPRRLRTSDAPQVSSGSQTEGLCDRCAKMNFEAVFSLSARSEEAKSWVMPLGVVTPSWTNSDCDFCRMIAAILYSSPFPVDSDKASRMLVQDFQGVKHYLQFCPG